MVVATLQVFGPDVRRTYGVERCFRWIADIRGRQPEHQPGALSVEVRGFRMRIPYVAIEADAYVSRCLSLDHLGTEPRIEARFRAQYGETSIDEVQVFEVQVPAPGQGFVDIEGQASPP